MLFTHSSKQTHCLSLTPPLLGMRAAPRLFSSECRPSGVFLATLTQCCCVVVAEDSVSDLLTRLQWQFLFPHHHVIEEHKGCLETLTFSLTLSMEDGGGKQTNTAPTVPIFPCQRDCRSARTFSSCAGKQTSFLLGDLHSFLHQRYESQKRGYVLEGKRTTTTLSFLFFFRKLNSSHNHESREYLFLHDFTPPKHTETPMTQRRVPPHSRLHPHMYSGTHITVMNANGRDAMQTTPIPASLLDCSNIDMLKCV